jgi:hypothetical protein
MATNRVFFSQSAVDAWLADGRVSLEGDVLRLLPDGPSFRLASAVHIQNEVAGGGDAERLVGKVKCVEAVAALGGELAGGSVVLGDNAYEAADGFVGELVVEPGVDGTRVRSKLAALSGEAG